MMKSSKSISDVYLACAQDDMMQGHQVAEKLTQMELNVFFSQDDPLTKASERQSWDAMAECYAVVLYIGDCVESDRIVFTVGAAQSWNKLIYIVHADTIDPSVLLQKKWLKTRGSYSMTDIHNLAAVIHQIGRSFTDSDQLALMAAYHQLDYSINDYLDEPDIVDELHSLYNRHATEDHSNEVLLSTLIRLNKAGKLKRTRNLKSTQRVSH